MRRSNNNERERDRDRVRDRGDYNDRRDRSARYRDQYNNDSRFVYLISNYLRHILK